MAKRIYQIAKTLGVKGVEIVHYLRDQGFDVKSHMSPVSAEMQTAVDAKYKPVEKAAKKTAKKAVKKVAKKTAKKIVKKVAKKTAKKAVKVEPVEVTPVVEAAVPEAPQAPAAIEAAEPAEAVLAPKTEKSTEPPVEKPAEKKVEKKIDKKVDKMAVQVVKKADQEAAAALAPPVEDTAELEEKVEEKPRVIRYAPGMEPGAPDRDTLLKNRGARSPQYSAQGLRHGRPGGPGGSAPRPGGGPARPGSGAGRPGGMGGGGGGGPMPPVADAGPSRGRRRKKKGAAAGADTDIKRSVRQTMANIGGRKKKQRRRGTGGAPILTAEERTEVTESKLRILPFSTLAELANAMKVPENELIASCLKNGLMVTMNQRLEREDIELIASEYEFEIEFISEAEEIGTEEIVVEEIPEDELEPRAPVVTVMGHVDHGKTKLLDYIRNAKVADGEAGAITQHIGAYSVDVPSRGKITFLDTPGHEAFTAMRARGTSVTDQVILVVAADDGVMPQTVEAIDHAKAGKVPIIVAINKMDLPAANPDKVKQELLQHGITVEDFGGDVVAVPISAKEGDGIDHLLEMVLMQAEMLDLKGAPRMPVKGIVVEARKDAGRGVVFTVLIQQGTLKVGMPFDVGMHYGTVRAMINEWGERVEEAGPAVPVEILGVNDVPEAGDTFTEADSEVKAREISLKRQQLRREQEIRFHRRTTLDELYSQISAGEVQELRLVLKGDVAGSVEAMADSFSKLSTDEVKVAIIHKSVGTVNESDVLLAGASDAIIIGFHVRPQVSVRELAKREQVEIRSYDIIYEAVEEIKQAMGGLLKPEIKEVVTGSAEVRQVFRVPKIGAVAGCHVIDGSIARSSKIRVLREGVVISVRSISSLRRFKDDVGKVESGFECGIGLVDFQDVKEGDTLEAFVTEEIARSL